MINNTNKTELGAIRILANTEEYTRKAEKELSRNIEIKLGDEEYKRVFNINGIAIVTAKEDIQEIKERKIKELIGKYESTIGYLLPPDLEDKVFERIEQKSKNKESWFEVIRTSKNPCEGTCKIIDKDTKVTLLETEIPIADKIIKATFGRTEDELQKADKLWEEIKHIINIISSNSLKVTRVDTDYCIFYICGNPNEVIEYESTLEDVLNTMRCLISPNEIEGQGENKIDKETRQVVIQGDGIGYVREFLEDEVIGKTTASKVNKSRETSNLPPIKE